jgi:hypothetical protein
MRRTTALSLLLSWPTLAWGQVPIPVPTDPPADPPTEPLTTEEAAAAQAAAEAAAAAVAQAALQIEMEALRAQATEANQWRDQATAERVRYQELLADAGRMMDPKLAPEARGAAARRVAVAGDRAVLPLLRAATRSRDKAVRKAALQGLVVSPDVDAVEIVRNVLLDGTIDDDTRTVAIHALGKMGRPAAGLALYDAIVTSGVTGPLKRSAEATLTEAYPALLAEKGKPVGRADGMAWASLLGSSAGSGAVLMSSVGVWGQSDAAISIGAVGGAAIGGAAGAMWLAQSPQSSGQGLRYASDVAWGLTGGVMVQAAVYDGFDGYNEADRNGAAAWRALGAAGGTSLGVVNALRHDPSPGDVLEQNLAGYVGLQLGMGIVDLADGQEGWGGYKSPRTRATAGLAGAGVGLLAGGLANEAWTLDGDAARFGALTTVAGGWLGGWLPVAIADDDPVGSVRIGIHGGAAIGLLGAQLRPFSAKETTMIGWGFGLGTGLGAGIPLLAGVQRSQPLAQVMVPVGVAGGVAGGLLAERVPVEGGDRAMIAFGVPVAMVEGLAIGSYIDAKGGFGESSEEVAGMALTAGSLTGLGLTALSPSVDPKPVNVAFVASTTGWGAYHGVLVPIALELDGQDEDMILTTTLTADAFLIAGGVLVSKKVGLDPRRTLLPQVGGIGGATLGSLGALLVSEQGDDAAKGALIGSTVGFVVGGVIEATRPKREASKKQARGSRELLPNLPGDWSATVAPTTLDGGQLGIQTVVRATGW